MINLIIMISGRGSNMSAILEAISEKRLDAHVHAVFSNNPNAPGLEIAKRHAIPTIVVNHKEFSSREDYEAAVLDAFRAYDVDLIVLAGYMRLLGSALISSFENRIINIHPSLLPEFKGLNAQAQALAAGVKEAGCTVHFVDESLDGGPIIAQRRVPVLEDDTDDSLSQRILVQEHDLYPEVLQLFSDKRLQIQDGTVTILPSS